MKRRTLLGAGFGLAQSLPGSPDTTGIKAQRLREGDTVGLAAPSSGTWEDEDVRFAIEIVESLGFRPKPGRHIFERAAYLAGGDEQRASDLNEMFADPGVQGIFAIRGGYGSQRLLPALDYEAIRRNPKVLLGYSDITALLNAVHKNTGLVTFHGPIAAQSYSSYTFAEFRKVLLEPAERCVIAAPPPFERGPGRVERANRITKIVGGTARGRLAGGNLTLLSTLMGTPYEPDFAGRILFFEDVDEAPYRIDRMLTHLWLAGALEKCAGFVAGKFTDATPARGRSRSIEEILRDRFEPLGKPALRGLMIGHVDDQTTLPLGIEAELDADAGTLTLLEPAVL